MTIEYKEFSLKGIFKPFKELTPSDIPYTFTKTWVKGDIRETMTENIRVLNAIEKEKVGKIKVRVDGKTELQEIEVTVTREFKRVQNGRVIFESETSGIAYPRELLKGYGYGDHIGIYLRWRPDRKPSK